MGARRVAIKRRGYGRVAEGLGRERGRGGVEEGVWRKRRVEELREEGSIGEYVKGVRSGERKCKNEFDGVANRGGVEPRWEEQCECEIEHE